MLIYRPAYEFSFAPYFLEKAALCSDPLERLKWVRILLKIDRSFPVFTTSLVTTSDETF
jgi:hypothetical protein